MPPSPPVSLPASGAPRFARAAAWGALAVAVAVLGVLGAHAAGLRVPYPGALLVLTAMLAAFGGGAGAGLVATLLTMLLTTVGPAAGLDGLPHGLHATALIGASQLVAITVVGVMHHRLELAVRRRLQAEGEAREAAAVFQAEQTLRLVLDNIPQRVFWKDREGRYLGCNAAFARDAGFASTAEVVGKTDFDMSWKEDAAAYRADDAAIVAGQGAKIGYEEAQHRPDGSVLWLRTSKVPMLDPGGAVVGVLGTYEDTTEQRRREEQLRIARADSERAAWLAHHDALTGLSNRVAFVEAIQRAMARATRDHACVAVLYVDLDGFKPVNDSLGHAVGDALLREVADRLSGAVRPTDRVARVGGDEFAILLEGVSGASECIALADGLLALLAKPYVVSGHELFLGASIGISLAGPSDVDGEALLKNADIAMFEAKRKGKGRHHVFSHNLDAHARRTLALTNQLHLALERNELSLAYQPKIALQDGRVIAFEALLRWDSAELGPVSPADFIPVAENTGLIDAIGDWVLETACGQAARWVAQGARSFICVNVSARQLRHPRFLPRLEAILRDTGLPPTRLELEITESVFITEPEKTIDVLLRIRDMGVGLVLDDFGTGYSSLSYLKQLPVNALKIDRAFIRELPDNASDASLVRGILGLAQTLGILVVAEGVESPGQVAFLREAACDAAQGYLFAAPLPAAEAEALLEAQWPGAASAAPYEVD